MIGALLVAALLAAPCEHPRLNAVPRERRDAACQLLAQEPGPATATASALAEVYGRPGFEHARQRSSGALKAWLAQLRAWLRTLFESSGAETYSSVTRVAVLALALMAGLGVALRFLRRRRPASPAGPPPAVAQPLALDSPEAHLARAHALLATAPREAAREGLLALLSTLERRRLARPDRVKTNRELVEELTARGASPSVLAAVAPLLRWFDDAWYSLAEVSVEEARRFLDEVKAVTG